MPKIAVAIIHGVGKQNPDFADAMKQELLARFVEHIGDRAANPADEVVLQPIYWAPALQEPEDELWKKMRQGGNLDYMTLRRFVVDFAADAIAYQPTPNDRQVYDDIHEIFAGGLNKLAQDAGPQAPLCVIAHSLGTVITCNYFYDLQKEFRPGGAGHIPPQVKNQIGDTPLERGETLSRFYTMGSPIAIWSLRYDSPLFGVPIQVPSPLLTAHYPGLKGEWVNYYDEDDILGYPLQTLNSAYGGVVKDRAINAGGLFSSWNPLSHTAYWTDNDVTKPIAASLAEMWKTVNQ